MIRSVTRWCVVGLTVCWANGSPASGQSLSPPMLASVRLAAHADPGELYGTIRDTRGKPLEGAIVSAFGTTLVFQVSDAAGRFTFRRLPPGTYVVRVHLTGYVPSPVRHVTVSAGSRHVSAIAMTPAPTVEERVILEAGVGGATVASPSTDDRNDGEMAWRLRNLKRGVLKDATLTGLDGLVEQGMEGGTHARGSPARLAAALFSDLTLSGHVNLLTTTSFDRPQELFTMSTGVPRPVADAALVAPTRDGEWTMRGTMTQGDVSSWVLAASYARHAPGPHRYEAGVSYSTQRYEGGNAEALAAMRDGSRIVGEIHGSDVWTVTPQWTIAVGGRYADYAYLDEDTLFSGRVTLELQPEVDGPLRLRLSAAHREIAPGAEEFVPPATGVWLPPERTFSELSRGVLRPERIDHVEIGGEHDVPGGFVIGLRAFRQQIGDQLVTLFAVPDLPATLGHYYVTTGGDFENYGWGAGVRRSTGAVRVSVDYTQTDTRRRGDAINAELLLVAPDLMRSQERIHDLTATLNTRVPVSATRLLVVYKLNNAYAIDAEDATLARFEVQVNQEIPFLDFTGAQWEMLAAVRNLFRSDLYDGSIYDELLVIRPPKRVMGGLTVRF